MGVGVTWDGAYSAQYTVLKVSGVSEEKALKLGKDS